MPSCSYFAHLVDWHLISINELCQHYSDVTMGAMSSQITSLTIVYSTVYSGADQRKHQCSASLAFVRGIHRLPVNSPHKWPVTQKMFSFGDVIMESWSDFNYVNTIIACHGTAILYVWQIYIINLLKYDKGCLWYSWLSQLQCEWPYLQNTLYKSLLVLFDSSTVWINSLWLISEFISS